MDHVDKIQAQWQHELPDADLSGQSIVARVHRLGIHLTREITAVYREFGLTEGEFDILCTIRRTGEPYEIRPADIAASTMVTTGGTSKRLEKLERAGLIAKAPGKGDGRSKIVRLTARGKDTIERAFEAHLENERRLISALNVSDQEQLEKILRVWLSEFEQ